MKSLEQEIKDVLSKNGVQYHDNSDSFKEPDFTIIVKDEPYFYLEAKEKRQHYNPKHWDCEIAEEDLFILDDLSVRKSLAYAPKSGFVIRDNPRGLYFFFSVVDLTLMPRKRINRRIERNVSTWKGKWLIDLRHGQQADSVEASFSQVRSFVERSEEILFKEIACYGEYQDEGIQHGGITRESKHWSNDREATR